MGQLQSEMVSPRSCENHNQIAGNISNLLIYMYVYIFWQLLPGESKKPRGWLPFAQNWERLAFDSNSSSSLLMLKHCSLWCLDLLLHLSQLGATVEEGPDYCVITPPEKLNITSIDTYDDHRMAMSFSLAACSDVPVTINDPGCTRKTFPDYFEVLQQLTKH